LRKPIYFMKKPFYIYILLLIFIGTSKSVFSQRGYKVIKKAQNKIEFNDFSKAIKLLNKAEKMDYGFCGNAWLVAKQEIDSLRFVAFYNLKKYDLARRSLDSIISFSKRDDLDSLKVLTYQKEYGNEFLKKHIKESLSSSYVECDDIIDCYGIIPLKNNKFIRFKIIENMNLYFMEENSEKQNKMWIEEFKKSKMYTMIYKID